MGLAVLYVPAHVEVEIAEKLPRIAVAARVLLMAVEDAWREYAGHVRVVDSVARRAGAYRSKL